MSVLSSEVLVQVRDHCQFLPGCPGRGFDSILHCAVPIRIQSLNSVAANAKGDDLIKSLVLVVNRNIHGLLTAKHSCVVADDLEPEDLSTKLTNTTNKIAAFDRTEGFIMGFVQSTFRVFRVFR
jgi:hypothetical protein